MKSNFIHIKIRDKNANIVGNSKIIELFKSSIGDNKINLNYKKKIEEYSKKNKKIIYYKHYIKKNIGKMIYKVIDNIKEIKIFNEKFIFKNKKKDIIIINNKKYELKGKFENKKQIFKIKIKFLDNILKLNSMFEDCKSLSYVHNFQYLNTKYFKTMHNLFAGCISLLLIDDISNWDINNNNDIKLLYQYFYKESPLTISKMYFDKFNNINKLIHQGSNLKSLPNISKWNKSNVNNISRLFFECSSLKSLPDISKWNTSNITKMSLLFYKCSSLKTLPDISKWDLSNVNNIAGMFDRCSSLEKLPDISKWNTKKVSNMSYLFYKCSKIKSLLKLEILMKYFMDALV